VRKDMIEVDIGPWRDSKRDVLLLAVGRLATKREPKPVRGIKKKR